MTEDNRVDELEEKVEELTQELERVKNRKTGTEKEKEVGEIQDQIKDTAEESDISRRKFMKMISGGAAGLSAAAMIPSVTGLRIDSDRSLKFGNLSSSETNVEVGTGGDLGMHGNDINDVRELKADKFSLGGDGPAEEFQEVSTVADVRNFAGAGLASKVENALDWLQNNRGSQGRVRVPPKDDGTAWTWDKNLTLDLSDDEGALIDVDDNVAIEYPGDGWALTVDNSWSGVTGNQRLKITGGRWTATGNPEGWLRVQDGFRTYIHPSRVDFKQSNNLGCAVSIENHDSYSESTQMRGTYVADIGVRFLSATETGGLGTDSFHDTHLVGVHINAYDTGIDLSGRVDMSELTKPSLFAKTDGVDLLVLDGSRLEGLTITSPKFENIGSNSNITPIAEGSNYDAFYGPLMVGGKFGAGLSPDDNDAGADIQWINSYGNELRLGKPNGSDVVINGDTVTAGDVTLTSVTSTSFNHKYTHDNGGNFDLETTNGGLLKLINSGTNMVSIGNSGVNFTKYDASDLSGTTGSQNGETRVDDGTNTTHGDPDLCIWNGSAWRQAGTDNTFS